MLDHTEVHYWAGNCVIACDSKRGVHASLLGVLAIRGNLSRGFKCGVNRGL